MAEEILPINDLIFKELIKRGYSLEGRTRIWDLGDSKLWYLKPDQAQGYLDLLKTKTYKQRFLDKEDALIDQSMKKIIDEVGNSPINLVDLGCGDGKRAVQFVRELRKKTKVRYCPIDISAYMVNKAVENVNTLTTANEVVDFQWNISDFDNTENILNLLRQGEYKKNFILFLGGTLGNSEFHDLMYQIYVGMKSDDLILIGNFLSTEEFEGNLIKGGVQKEHADWLIKVPLQLGLLREDIEVSRRIRNQRSEIYFTLKKDHTIHFGGREVNFFKGDQIIVLVAYLYPKEQFKKFMGFYFDNVDIKVSPDGTYSLTICKK
jgi:SAM-dependent methyltransferase